MRHLYKFIASCFGVGYLKGGGTVASMLTCLAWFFLQRDGIFKTNSVAVIMVLLITGIICANKVEKEWGEDSSRVVIDEVAGMCITLLFIPVKWQLVLAGLVLFRFFDIVKPLFVRWMEKLPGGWGVMGDDVLAGIWSNIVLQIISYLVR